MTQKSWILIFGIICFFSACGIAVYMGSQGSTRTLTLWCAGLLAIGLSICSAFSSSSSKCEPSNDD